MPVTQSHFARTGLVLIENAGVRGDPFLIQHIEVRLFVQGKRAVIQIGGTHQGPAVIHEQILAVITRGLVFVKARSCFEQWLPSRLADSADSVRIKVRPRRDDLHFHTAMQRPEQRAPAQVIWNELRIGDANGLPGGGDGNEQHQAGAVEAFTGGAFENLAGNVARSLELWKIGVAMQ